MVGWGRRSECALTLREHTEGVASLALSSDAKRLFSGSGDKTIKVWDLAP